MSKWHKILMCMMMALGSTVSYSTENCVSCGPSEVTGMPVSGLGGLEKIAKSNIAQVPDSTYMKKFCSKFKSIESENLVKTVLDEMETTPYGVDEYLQKPECTIDSYSEAVKSPMLHIVADDPVKRQHFLKKIMLYYTKKRNRPDIFSQALNSLNTKGETLLDYIESSFNGRFQKAATLKQPFETLIKFICTNGGVYSKHKDKKCL